MLLWLLLQRAEVYRAGRRVLVVMASLALLVFWLVPMSPPRLALGGIVDVVAEHDPIAGGASRDLTNGHNHYSAMPSLHVGWTALCAYAAWLALRDTHPRLALLTWLFPTVMIAVVISTGNHYVLDVAGSAVLLTISIVAATVWDRAVQHRGTHRSDRSAEAAGADKRVCRSDSPAISWSLIGELAAGQRPPVIL